MKMTLLFLLCIAFCQNAYANLILNGGFEDPQVPDRSWQWFTSDQVVGWEGSNIEIWDSLNRFEAYQGEQHAELNAHGQSGPFSIFQSFATNLGETYEVSFAYAARRNQSEAFNFDITDASNSILFTSLLNQHRVKNWSTFNTRFVATSALTTIRFTTVNQGSYGNFLDAVSVVTSSQPSLAAFRQSNVPEPSTIMLILLAIALLAVKRFWKS